MASLDKESTLTGCSCPDTGSHIRAYEMAPSAIPLQKAVFDLASWLMMHTRDGKPVRQ